ncbi:MAG: aspartyl/asparaginyl beta-hydroxylase domain-containing protein [Pseudomonadales bacterium]|jgi:hypothetical protein
MNIDVPLRNLGPVDFTPLQSAINRASEEQWLENQYRQRKFEVHSQTQSLVMYFLESELWPKIKVNREPGYELLAEAAQPLMDKIIQDHYEPGGVIIRAMAAKLLPDGIIKPHVDKHASFEFSHRIHIPIVTNPKVRFMINGRPNQFQVGNAYEINNQLQHSVMNKGSEARTTFIFDYVPPSQMHKFELVA